MLNAISVDVEESYHATNFAPFVPRESWSTQPSRVVPSTQIVLDLFAKHGVKGTFFVLGDVAKRHPDLVRSIVEQGHELASHGFNHELVYDLTPTQFLKDISDSKSLLEDISGNRVLGYRAPNFSITDRCTWGYDMLLEAGFVYDASLYPVQHPRYANADKPRTPFKLTRETGSLFIFPAATASFTCFGKELRLPVAGGAYWRLLPSWYCNWGLKRISKVDGLPFVCYVHPWEFDTEQAIVKGPSLVTQLRHYAGIKGLSKKVDRQLTNFSFTTIRNVGESFFGDEAQIAFGGELGCR